MVVVKYHSGCLLTEMPMSLYYPTRHYKNSSSSLNVDFPSLSLFFLLYILTMVTLPTLDPDSKHDVHAPASTYYTTGDNARQRTRTYTVGAATWRRFDCAAANIRLHM